MRVVHLFKDYYPPTNGGIEQHLNVLCTRLARTLDVTVLVPSRSSRRVEEEHDGVRVIRVPEFGWYRSAPFCPTMPVELRRLHPDLVHLHFPNPTGDFAYLLSGCRAPAVMTYHADVVRQRMLLRLYRPFFRLLLPRIARIIGTSAEYLASSPLISRFRGNCTVVPFGVDLEGLALRDGEGSEIERVRLDYGDRIVLFLGVLRYYKGVDVLIEAMRKVHGVAVIAGRGPLRDHLQRLAGQLNLDGRIVFLGEVPEARRRVLLHACDVFALPSIDRSEAFGIAQLEAMACGKPVVASDLPTGVRFVNQHGVTGLRVPPRDPGALAAALTRLLDDGQLRRRLGEMARRRVEQEFTVERMVVRTLEVYRQVLEPSGGASPCP